MLYQSYDVAIVGGGAAGLSAALVLARSRRRVVVLDAASPRNAPAAHLHNFLTRDGMSPAELLSVGRSEVRAYGGDIVSGTVTEVESTSTGFCVRLDDGSTLAARRLLTATGLTDELPEIPGVRERWGRDVLHCPYCHGYEVRDQPLGVLGTGPRSVHQALLVRQLSPDVVFFRHTLPDLAAEDHERLAARDVRVVEGSIARLVVSGDRLMGVQLSDGSVVERAAVFIAPRFIANDAIVTALGVDMERNALATWIATDANGQTSVPGVWAAGNVADPGAFVIGAAAAGARVAAVLNADLVEADVARAVGERARAGVGVPA